MTNVRELVDRMKEAFKSHPIAAIGVAFGAGYVAGLALAERSRTVIGRAAVATISGVIVALAREQLVHQARSWIDERRAPAPVH